MTSRFDCRSDCAYPFFFMYQFNPNPAIGTIEIVARKSTTARGPVITITVSLYLLLLSRV